MQARREKELRSFVMDHAHGASLWRRLGHKDRKKVLAFLIENQSLGKAEFQHAVDKMHLDKERSTMWTFVEEILSCVNTSTREEI